MNFNAPLLRPLRILLFPFSLVYGLIVYIRNKLFDKNIISSSAFNLPVIGVGNLSAGGTGKSPMVEYVAASLMTSYRVAILSRGYKRKTSGYALAGETSTAIEIGDEPMLFHSKLPGVTVAVGEERIVAIPQLLHDRPDTQVIIMDDAFQHRYIKAGLDIVLTEYSNLFTRDWFLPTGDLRDMPSSYKRAHIIVVTKCPAGLQAADRDRIVSEIKPVNDQSVFFTSITYTDLYHLVTRESFILSRDSEVLLITGIANPGPLKRHIAANSSTYYEILYEDHHIFTVDDLKDIRRRFETIASDKKIIVTTEKDAVRLAKFRHELRDYPVYVLPIRIEFLFDAAPAFMGLITNFISSFSKTGAP